MVFCTTVKCMFSEIKCYEKKETHFSSAVIPLSEVLTLKMGMSSIPVKNKANPNNVMHEINIKNSAINVCVIVCVFEFVAYLNITCSRSNLFIHFCSC